MGLGAGNDCVHIACWLDHGCNRIAPDFFPGRRHLHDRAQRNGRYYNPIAGARMRRSSAGSRRSTWDAGAAGGDAKVLNRRAAVDGVLHCLRGDERRIFRRGLDIRLRAPTEFARQHLWLRNH